MLVIIRGIPGSSKSTLARTKYIPMGYVHFEADMFFMKDGHYFFDKNRIHNAHVWCQNSVKESLINGKDVVVSNTFTTHKEMDYYLKLSSSLNIPVKVIHARGKFKNVHNVPQEVLEKMEKRWEPFSGEEFHDP